MGRTYLGQCNHRTPQLLTCTRKHRHPPRIWPAQNQQHELQSSNSTICCWISRHDEQSKGSNHDEDSTALLQLLEQFCTAAATPKTRLFYRAMLLPSFHFSCTRTPADLFPCLSKRQGVLQCTCDECYPRFEFRP